MNVGSGDSQSINHLVEILGGDVVYVPKRPGEPDCTQADITKIKKMLGWEPLVSFEEGVKVLLKNINYWKNAPLWTPDKIQEATKEWFQCLAKEQ
jgi:UDP-glucose 4-epimerase